LSGTGGGGIADGVGGGIGGGIAGACVGLPGSIGGTIPGDRSGEGSAATLAPMAAERATPFTKLSVFFPMWNEEAYIDRAIETAAIECRSLMARDEILDYELIIVDDASTDHTGKLADEMAAADPHIRVVHHPVNRKLGGSMKTGFATATGDVVLYSDADLPFDMTEVSHAIRLMRYYEADIVSAFRFDRTGEGSLRTVYTFFYNFLIRRLFGVRMRDINFAFKLCRRSIFEHISLSSEGSFIDAELIIRAKKLGFNVIQFGVDYFPRTRGESTLASGSVIRKIITEMVQLRRELRHLQPVVRPFD
jgi:glycosyltransferase involved in cell wall biosynthesis